MLKEEAGLYLSVSKISQHDEFGIGADLGIILSVTTHETRFVKGILLQAKRLMPKSGKFSPGCQYGDFGDEHGLKQANDMLNKSIASFFMFYNPEITGVEGLKVGEDILELPRSDLTYPVFFSNGVRMFRLGDRFRGGQYPPLGVIVVPALFRLNWSGSSTIEQLFKYTLPFSTFFVDDFIQCKVGDYEDRLIKMIRREDQAFPVRYGLEIRLSTG